MLVLVGGEVPAVAADPEQDPTDREEPVGVLKPRDATRTSQVDRLGDGDQGIQGSRGKPLPQKSPGKLGEGGDPFVDPEEGEVTLLDGGGGGCGRGQVGHSLDGPGQSARVNRGGGWNNNDAANVRGANRNRNAPSNRNNNLGFRCAHQGRQSASNQGPMLRVCPGPCPGPPSPEGGDPPTLRQVSR